MLKTYRLTVKLTPAHKMALGRLAKLEDESVAALVRRLIRAEAQQRGFWTKPIEVGNSIPGENELEVNDV